MELPLRAAADAGPGELIAAAHAQSFTHSLSKELGLRLSAAGSIVTTASVTLDHLAAGWTIIKVHLHVVARIAGLSQERFIDSTVRAKTTCMVSRSLRANISMTAKLEK